MSTKTTTTKALNNLHANGKHLGILSAATAVHAAKALGITELVEEAVAYHALLKSIRDSK